MNPGGIPSGSPPLPLAATVGKDRENSNLVEVVSELGASAFEDPSYSSNPFRTDRLEQHAGAQADTTPLGLPLTRQATHRSPEVTVGYQTESLRDSNKFRVKRAMTLIVGYPSTPVAGGGARPPF